MSNSVFAALALVAGLAFIPQNAHAHSDVEPLWEMDQAELEKLEQSIERHRLNLAQAIEAAMESGVTSSPARPFLFDSNQEVADIPRSVLNRVIIESLNLETASTRLYVFCNKACERSLFKDLADEPNREEALRAVRGIWPKIESSFRVLWHDIPVGVWKRFIHASSYSRAVLASARYQSKAYGGFSMAVGAATFGAAFGVTEIAESMFMGPLHFVCKANYFWSVALAAAVASFSRDIKTLFLFEKDGATLFERIARTLSGYRSLYAVQNLEKRVLFRSLVGENAFTKLSRRDAHSSVLEHWLDTPSARQAVAADSLLWSDLAAHLKKVDRSDRTEAAAELKDQKLLGSEISEIFKAGTIPTPSQRRWQDVHASLRTLLRVLRNGIDVGHQLHGDRAAEIKIIGTLDQQLRAFDVFTNAWLLKKSIDQKRGNPESAEAAKWLRSQLTEWIAIAFAASERGSDVRDLQSRLELLQASLDVTIRSGTPERTCRALFLPTSI